MMLVVVLILVMVLVVVLMMVMVLVVVLILVMVLVVLLMMVLMMLVVGDVNDESCSTTDIPSVVRTSSGRRCSGSISSLIWSAAVRCT